MDRDSKPNKLTFQQLVQHLRKWATTPIGDDETERINVSLIKSGRHVTQVDIEPKKTHKGVMTID